MVSAFALIHCTRVFFVGVALAIALSLVVTCPPLLVVISSSILRAAEPFILF